MGNIWKLYEAKSKFTEVVEKALTGEPQVITRRGVKIVVVVSVKEYRNLTKPRTSLKDFFARSPLKGGDLDLQRDPDLGRPTNLGRSD